MRRVFISYARENKRDVDDLVEHLGLMGYDTWVDYELRGGQDWWQEIMRRITGSDVFIAAVSRASLVSTTCQRELDWAETTGRPVLPVAVELVRTPLPGRFASRQVIDYSQPGQRQRAALMLQGGIGALPPAPPLPDPLPDPPPAPMSYLTDLVEQITQADHIDQTKQREIVERLSAVLRSVDPEERRGGRDALDRFASRTDLYADVDRAIGGLRQQFDELHPVAVAEPVVPPLPPNPVLLPAFPSGEQVHTFRPESGVGPYAPPYPFHGVQPRRVNRRRKIVISVAAAAIVAAIVATVLYFVVGSKPSDEDQIRAGVAGMTDAWNRSDYAAWRGYVCTKLKNENHDNDDNDTSEAFFKEARPATGRQDITVQSVHIDGDNATVYEKWEDENKAGKDPTDTAGTGQENWARESGHWKWCGYPEG